MTSHFDCRGPAVYMSPIRKILESRPTTRWLSLSPSDWDDSIRMYFRYAVLALCLCSSIVRDLILTFFIRRQIFDVYIYIFFFQGGWSEWDVKKNVCVRDRFDESFTIQKLKIIHGYTQHNIMWKSCIIKANGVQQAAKYLTCQRVKLQLRIIWKVSERVCTWRSRYPIKGRKKGLAPHLRRLQSLTIAYEKAAQLYIYIYTKHTNPAHLYRWKKYDEGN